MHIYIYIHLRINNVFIYICAYLYTWKRIYINIISIYKIGLKVVLINKYRRS